MRIATSLICVLLLSTAGHAQDRPDGRLQLRGVTGWTAYGDNSLIHHGVVGGAADLRLIAGFGVGSEVLYEVGPQRDRDVTIMPMIRYDFMRRSRVSPFVSGGFGMLFHTDGGRWSDSFSVGAGGGVKLAITERLFVAPEVRVGWEPLSRVLVSIGYRF